MNDRRERVRSMRLLKGVLVGGGVVVACLYALLDAQGPLRWAVVCLAALLVLELVVFLVLWDRQAENERFWLLASLGEFVLVSALAWVTGGFDSPLLFLLLIVPALAGARGTPWTGVGLGVLASLLMCLHWVATGASLARLGAAGLSGLVGWIAAFPAVGSFGFLLRIFQAEEEEAREKSQSARLERALQLSREQALQKELALEKLYDKTRKLTSLMQVSRHLATVRRVDLLLAEIVKIARQEMNSSIAVVFLVRGKELVPAHSYGLSEISLRALQCRVGEGLFGEMVVRGEPLRLSEKDGDRELGRIVGTREKFRHLLAVPLKTPQDKLPFGILAAANVLVGDRFEEEHEGYLKILATDAAIALKNISLFNELERAYYETIQALAQAIEAKDPYTHGHVGRVRTYAVRLARALKLSEEEVDLISKAAILHDVGKISTPDCILNKEGPLTDDEFEIMKAHAENSLYILKDIRSLPPRVIDMVVHHHERWDGKGYPHGLEGEEIPLGGQIISIADCYDAMTSDRPYRKGFTPEEALRRMEKGMGSQFNPRLLQVFFDLFGYKPERDLSATEEAR